PGSRCDLHLLPLPDRGRRVNDIKETRMADYVAALDQGTTSTRCMLFDHGGNVVSSEQLEHEQIYPRPGWVEHDSSEIWQRSRQVMDAACQKASGGAGAVA